MKMLKTKKFKGMTLIEILVALAIFAMLGSILVLAGVQIDRTMKGSNKLKKKMVTQSPYAANQIEYYEVANGTTESFATQPITINVVYKNGAVNESVNIDAYKVDTEEIIMPTGMSSQQAEAYRNSVNSRLNYKFIKLCPTTGSTTSATP